MENSMGAVTAMRAVTAKYIFDGANLLSNKVLLIAAGRVVALLNRDQEYPAIPVEDYGESVISAGLIDLQLNGCGGVVFNQSLSFATLETMHQTNLRFGTSSFLPTLITADFHDVVAALELIRVWFQRYGNRRGVIGLHLEGPFISRAKRGIHPEEFILEPTEEMLAQIASYRQFFPIKMTLAPECFSLSQIDYLVAQGIIVSLGHTNASFAQAQAAFAHGAATVTHMFNAMSGMTARNPGVIAAVLANPCYMGIIVDLLHVDPANVALVVNLKPSLSYLITDAVTPTGTSMSEFNFAGKHLYVREGKCVDAAGTLGGACLTLNAAVQNCVVTCALRLEQALAMASIIPARLMGLEHELGRIAPGYRADLIAMDLANYSCQIIAVTSQN